MTTTMRPRQSVLQPAPTLSATSKHVSPTSRRNKSVSQAVASHYNVINCIGRGASGTVFQVSDRHVHRLQAIKVVRKSDLKTTFAKQSLHREIAALDALRHRHILHFHETHDDADFVYIATEYCGRGDLLDLLRRSSLPLPERRALSLMRQLFSAVQFLHARGISHRDIKLQNVLLATNGTLRLADFGVVHRDTTHDLRETSSRICGTADYVAPEVLARRPYVPRFVDLWQCGVTLFLLLTREKPFDTTAWRDAHSSDIRLQTVAALRHQSLANISKPCRQLLRGLLAVDPATRLSADDAIALCDEAIRSTPSSRK